MPISARQAARLLLQPSAQLQAGLGLRCAPVQIHLSPPVLACADATGGLGGDRTHDQGIMSPLL